MTRDPDPAEVPGNGEGDDLPDGSARRPVRGSDERESATTTGAPYPPADTQNDGPARRAPRVPSSAPSDENPPEQTSPTGGDDA